MDRVGRQESRAQLNGFASAARAIKAALRSLSPPSSPRTPRTVSGGYVNSDSGKGGGASSPSPLTPRSAASVQHYCQACKIKPVVSGSKNPVHCSGQYPFQCCCVCAVEAGWKGWDHHACFQCKAEIGINVEPVTPEKEEVKAVASTESLPHADSCKIMSPRHTMCCYTMPSMVTHVITSHRGNAANTVVASEKSNEPPASPRAHANRGIDREATSGNSLSILVSGVTVPVMSHATATRSSLRIALDATSLANSDDNSLQVQGLSPEAESQHLEVHEAIEQEAVSTQQTQKILPELKWQYQTSPWTMTPSVVTWNSYGCGLGGSPKQVRVPCKWSSTAKMGKGPRILFSQAEEALQELQLQLQAKKRELDCLRIKHALDLKAERRENLGVHLATLKDCMVTSRVFHRWSSQVCLILQARLRSERIIQARKPRSSLRCIEATFNAWISWLEDEDQARGTRAKQQLLSAHKLLGDAVTELTAPIVRTPRTKHKSPEDTATQNIATSGWNGKDLTAELEELTGQEEFSI